MKSVYEKTFKIGKEDFTGGIYVDGYDVYARVSYSTAKVLEPATRLVDTVVDKLESLLPGDQKAWADGFKVEVRGLLTKLFVGGAQAPVGNEQGTQSLSGADENTYHGEATPAAVAKSSGSVSTAGKSSAK